MADSIYDSDEEVPVVSPATAPKPTALAASAEADGAPRRKSMNGKSLGHMRECECSLATAAGTHSCCHRHMQ